MTAMSYRMLGMMTDACPLTLESLAQRLADGLPDTVRVERSPEVVRVIVGDLWSYVIGLSEAAHVQDESREIANMFGRSIDEKMQIGECKRRLETGGAADESGAYAETFAQILAVLKSFEHLILFDVSEPKILANTVPEGSG